MPFRRSRNRSPNADAEFGSEMVAAKYLELYWDLLAKTT